MKQTLAVFFGLFLTLSLSTAWAMPGSEFTLSPYAENSTNEARIAAGWSPGETGSSSAEATTKRPWIAALETFSINIGVWAIDRYVMNKDYAHISWSSWKYNLEHGWIWCPDVFATSFFGHPFHGSQYFNTARSLGLNFWESLPYAAVGYVMWGYFMEKDQPSKNDLIMTSLGGICLGEIEFRLSSQVLDDTASGGQRIWREILAFVIDPIRGLNRLIYGDDSRVGSANRELREPLHGTVALSGFMVSEAANLSKAKFSPAFDYDLTYGLSSSEVFSSKPYDLFFLNGEVRYGQSKGFFTIDACGLLAGHEFGSSDGSYSVVGLFQHYDFMGNEILNLGSTSLGGGLVSLVPLGSNFSLTASVQLGLTPIGGVKNPYVLVEDRDYNYDWGGMAKVEVWLSHPKAGTLAVRLGRFQLYSINAAAPTAADEGHDFLTYLRANYSLPLARNLGLRLEYSWYDLRQHFNGHPAIASKLSRIGGGLEVAF